MAEFVIEIDMGKRCAECRKFGACQNGLCMGCTANAMYGGKALKSAEAKAVRDRLRRDFPPKGND